MSGGLEDMHDDEIRAKLGLAPLGRPMTVEERIVVLNLREMPEPHNAEGEIILGDELDEWRRVAFEQAKYWPAGTGFALRDWLRTQGHDPQPLEWSTT